MSSLSHPLQFILVALAGWINQQQREVIDYLQEENRVLREQIGARRLRFTDDQRRRLAARARILGRQVLGEIATIVSMASSKFVRILCAFRPFRSYAERTTANGRECGGE